MKIIHKPVALAWRQRASSALRARAAATLPCRAFMNNPHGCDTYKSTEDTEEKAGQRLAGQAGAAFSNPSTSELARDSENTSLTRSVSSTPLAAQTPRADSKGLIAEGEAALQPSTNKRELIAEANSPATSYPLPATAPEAQVFVLGIPPMATWWEGARERNAVIREINALLAEGAKENGYRFIDLESVLADENGFLRGEVTSDGVHLSAKGYMAVLQKVKEGPLRGK